MIPFLSQQKTQGAIVIDGKHVADTRQCVHCGKHEQIIPGSGKKRGMCLKCNNGFVCGAPACMVCIPYKIKIDYMEAKANNDIKAQLELLKFYPELGRILV